MKMLIFLTLFFAPLSGFAQTGSLFSYEGILTDAGGTPISTSSSVTFQILYGTCVTFEEIQSVTPGANGEFSVIIGAGSRQDNTLNTIAKIFGSSGTVACEGAASQPLSGFAVRQLHVRVGAIDLLPDVVIGNVPFSWNAQKLADKSATDFIQVDGTNGVTQTNVASIFSRYAALDAIINGDFSGTPVTGITGINNASIVVGAAIDRTKLANGTASHVVINTAGGVLSSEAQLAISRGGTGVSTAPANGQVLIGNGTGYALSNITAGTGITVTNAAGSITIASTAGVGSVTSIATGAGLTGGTITGSGTIGLGTELSAINGLATTGIVHRTGVGTYATVGVPAGACAAGEALTWQSPVNAFACYSLTVDTAHVSGLNAAVDARIAADTTKLDRAGGTMSGNINLGNNQLSNVGYVHLQNKAADPGGLVAGNEGFVWYNSTDKMVKYYNGTAINSLPGYAGACADGQILKWNDTTKVWACGADAGAGGGANATQLQGANVSATTPTAGQFLKLVGTDWTPTSMPVCAANQVMLFNAGGVATCTAISGLTDSAIAVAAAIARNKLATGTFNHVLINDGSGVMSSEAQLAISRGGTGIGTAPTADQVLVGNASAGYDLKTLTAGTGVTISTVGSAVTITATATAPVDSDYGTKGVVGFQTDAATSGMVYSSAGIAKVNTGTGASQIVKLDGTGKLPAVDGSALTNVNDATKLPLAGGAMIGAIAMGSNNITNVGDITMANSKVLGLSSNASDPASPAVGQMWYNSTSNTIKYYDGLVKTLGVSGSGLQSLGGLTDNTQTFATSTVGATFGFSSATGTHTLNIPIATASKDGLLSTTDFATFNGKLSAVSNTAALTDLKVWIGDGSGKAQERSLSGAFSIDNTGVATLATVSIAKGGTGQITKTAAYNALSPMTTKGDITVHNGTDAVRLGVGTNGKALVADSASTEGVKWGDIFATDLVNISGLGIVQKTAAGAYTTLGTTAPLAVVTGNITLSPLVNADISGSAAIDAAKLAGGSIDNNEFGYLDGVTSTIQTQLDNLTASGTGKVSKTGDTMTGNLIMSAQQEVRFADSDSDHFVAIRSPATVAADYTLTLPAAVPASNGQVLSSNTAGVTSWVAQAAAPGDAAYGSANKGLVAFATDAATSGISVAAGVASVYTGTGINQILKFTTAATLPALNGNALTNLDVANITSASGKYFSYKPNGIECGDGEILKWVAASDQWVCGTAADLGAITSVVASTGLDVNTAAGAATVSVEAELGALNGLATTGYVQRTGAATYSTTAGNTLNSNSTVVTRDGTGVSGFSGVILNNLSMNVTQVAPSAGTSYQVTWPAGAPASNGQVLTSTTLGVMSWVSALTTVTSTDIVDATIANADISGTAAITRTKFANGNANRVVINTTGGVMSEAAAITANRALISDANGIPTHSAVTDTDLAYVSGVTSSIQTQLDAKVAKTGDTMTGNLVMNAQKEVRFADGDSDHFVAIKSPATVTADYTLTLPTAVPASNGQVLSSTTAGVTSWITPTAAPGDAGYGGANKGLVAFATDAATSGITVASGVASVYTGTGINQILKFTTAATLPALDGSNLTALNASNISSGTLAVNRGGTGQTSYTNGQLLIGNTTGNTLTKATLTQGTGVTITNGAGTITIAADPASSITDGTIIDADVNATAAIARSKLANGNNNEVLINNSSGVMTSEAQLAVSRGGTGTGSFPNFNGLVMSGSTGTAALASITCAATGRMLEWTGATWGCSKDFLTSGTPGSKVNYVLLNGADTTFGVSVSAAGSDTNIDLSLNAKGTTGLVIVGNNLKVTNETASKTFRTIASVNEGTTTFDFSDGNLQHTTLSCNGFTLNGMKDGGTYVLAVKGTGGTTCSFTAGALAIKLPPDHGPTEAGKSTLYTFMVMGTDVYVSWVTGY